MHIILAEALKPKPHPATGGIASHFTLGVILAIVIVVLGLIFSFVIRMRSRDPKTMEPTVGIIFPAITYIIIGVLCGIGGNFKTMSHLVHTVTGGKVGTP